MPVLKQSFFDRDTLTAARELIGQKLVRQFNDVIVSGMIVEAEAYIGRDDSACHASKGKTPRNIVMFGPAGIAYVYLVYGMHYMLNIVTESIDSPCAVLLRAIKPIDGQAQMERLRMKNGKDMTNGPAKLCQAMAIDKTLNGWDVTRGEKLWIEACRTYPDKSICRGPRIGINYAKLKDRQAPWRFWVNL
ncbi:MAG: DNA-3-methyladenine glycosylase [Thermodesulfobacteriota bacterium]|nr:DNA-3-methyladenine glycosylase [Thermodesulfobacteriota bacterium]